jgi:hypothetical protein
VGSGFLNVDQSRANALADVFDRFEKHQVKKHDRESGDERGRPVMPAHPRETWCESDDAEKAEQDDDGVEAGALPIATAEVQPHSKFIEGERHAKTVEERAKLTHPIARPGCEDEQTTNRGEEKDAVKRARARLFNSMKLFKSSPEGSILIASRPSVKSIWTESAPFVRQERTSFSCSRRRSSMNAFRE